MNLKNCIWHIKRFGELSTDELYRIIQLRIEVFVVEQDAPYQDCDDKDRKALHLFGEMNGEILAYLRLLPAGVSYDEPSIGRVVTRTSIRGTGLGKAMLDLGLEAAKNYFETTANRISAQSYLKSFYEQYGFRQVSEEYLEDNLPHIEMLKPISSL